MEKADLEELLEIVARILKELGVAESVEEIKRKLKKAYERTLFAVQEKNENDIKEIMEEAKKKIMDILRFMYKFNGTGFSNTEKIVSLISAILFTEVDNIIPDINLDTIMAMAKEETTGKYIIFYNPTLVYIFDEWFIRFVLIHELFHILRRDVERARLWFLKMNNNEEVLRTIWNMASDTQINERIKTLSETFNDIYKELKLSIMTAVRLSMLLREKIDPFNMSTEEIAELILSKLKQEKKPSKELEYSSAQREKCDLDVEGQGIHPYPNNANPDADSKSKRNSDIGKGIRGISNDNNTKDDKSSRENTDTEAKRSENKDKEKTSNSNTNSNEDTKNDKSNKENTIKGAGVSENKGEKDSGNSNEDTKNDKDNKENKGGETKGDENSKAKRGNSTYNNEADINIDKTKALKAIEKALKNVSLGVYDKLDTSFYKKNVMTGEITKMDVRLQNIGEQRLKKQLYEAVGRIETLIKNIGVEMVEIEDLLKIAKKPKPSWQKQLFDELKRLSDMGRPKELTMSYVEDPTTPILAKTLNNNVFLPMYIAKSHTIDIPILISIDESGSISDEELERILGEIRVFLEMGQFERVSIVAHDVDIKEIYKGPVSGIVVRRIVNKLKKRVLSGGTDITKVLEYAKKIKAKLVIEVTDTLFSVNNSILNKIKEYPVVLVISTVEEDDVSDIAKKVARKVICIK